MKNKALFILLILATTIGFSQKFYTDSGLTEFNGSKAAFEPIKAQNSSTISLFNVESGNIAAIIFINKFDFRLGLMQEHFNENYMESDKFPRSTFEGKIENFDYNKLNNIFQNYNISGMLTIKGVSRNITTIAKVKKEQNKIKIISSFSIKLSDFNVKIPKIVFKKINEEVKINLSFTYDKK
tara:strand:- start:359 stop:904 length:546 start_codon:yes stop_codon:yes gene_type:complete